MDIDSPGGSDPSPVAELLYSARSKMRTSTLATGTMASASLWIGSAADEVYSASPLNAIGSIGAYLVRYEKTPDAAEGKAHYITAGKQKLYGKPDTPMTEEERDYFQKAIDQSYEIFIKSVAKYRGVSAETVLSEWADGQTFQAVDAVKLGLIDGIATLDDLLND